MLRENKSFKINFTIELFQMLGYTGKDAVALRDAKNEKLRFFISWIKVQRYPMMRQVFNTL